MFSSLVSFLEQTPSEVSVVAIAETEVERVDYLQIQKYYGQYHIVSEVGRKIIEYMFIYKAKKELEIMSKTAEERYQDLIDQSGHLILDLPVKEIASYLGIHPESLSPRCKEFWDSDPKNYYISNARPFDNMAGGYRGFSEEMETVVNTAVAGKQCFIPLFSALAINTTDDNYSVFNDPNVMSKTPFAAIYCPAENEKHVQITTESHNWLFQQIRPDLLDVATTFLPKGHVNIQARTEVRLLPGFSTGSSPTFRIFVGDFTRCNTAAPMVTEANSTDATTGIDAAEDNSDNISIYPNPASDFVTIAAQNQELKQIELLQADGKLLKTIQPQQGNYQLNLDDIHAGMYFIRVIGSKENVVKKIVVTR